MMEEPGLFSDPARYTRLAKEHAELAPLVALLQARRQVLLELAGHREWLADGSDASATTQWASGSANIWATAVPLALRALQKSLKPMVPFWPFSVSALFSVIEFWGTGARNSSSRLRVDAHRPDAAVFIGQQPQHINDATAGLTGFGAHDTCLVALLGAVDRLVEAQAVLQRGCSGGQRVNPPSGQIDRRRSLDAEYGAEAEHCDKKITHHDGS